MEDDKDQPKKASTCLEDTAHAAMMQKILGEQGIGSLCEERMRSLLQPARKDDTEIRSDTEIKIKRRNNMIESLMKLHKCADCSIRCRASRKPRSLFARIHRWHATWWPGWKLYLAESSARSAKALPRV